MEGGEKVKQTQGVYIAGYVTIKVVGHHPELFFDLCARQGITTWNIRKIGEMVCHGNIKLSDVNDVKTLRRKTIYKLSFIGRKGLPFITNKFLFKKPLVISLLLSMFFVLFLSNIVWDVKIKGVHPELEKQIIDQLDEYGIQPGAMKFSIGSPSKIQQKLLDDIPELLWVGVTENGTTYHLEGVEKTIVEESEKLSPRNIVASKEGVIVDMFVSKGQPMVGVNDFVEKGDVLVSGALGKNEDSAEEGEDEEEDSKPPAKELVAAEGEVIAKTWYETEVNIPLDTNYEVLSGENKKKYYLRFGGFLMPIWGFTNPDFENVQMEVTEKSINFLKWELPISYVKQNIQEKEYVSEKRTPEEAKVVAIKQATKNLQEKLGQEAKINFEKVLQERKESGKVKLTLYFTVYENIAKSQPISQGD